jgi:hypothetical protein
MNVLLSSACRYLSINILRMKRPQPSYIYELVKMRIYRYQSNFKWSDKALLLNFGSWSKLTKCNV